MTTPFDRSRYDWMRNNAAVVLKSDGTPRAALRVPLKIFTVHYGGAGSSWTDYGDTRDELWGVELYARSAGKPNEYNVCGDSEGVTWEYAGPWQAAHSGGENHLAFGHLTLYGLENLTEVEAQGLIKGIRRSRQQAVDAGYITPDHEVIAHQDMPGGNTSCPGPLYDNKRWWGQIIAPLDSAPLPPVPPSGYKRIAMASNFEFASATRWDTRGFGAPIPAGEYAVKLDGSAGKVGATVNLTITQAKAAGFASAWKGGARPDTSKINYQPNQSIANEVKMALAPDGTFKIFINKPAHIVIDLVGYWT